jgi:hypothetical protein
VASSLVRFEGLDERAASAPLTSYASRTSRTVNNWSDGGFHIISQDRNESLDMLSRSLSGRLLLLLIHKYYIFDTHILFLSNANKNTMGEKRDNLEWNLQNHRLLRSTLFAYAGDEHARSGRSVQSGVRASCGRQ